MTADAALKLIIDTSESMEGGGEDISWFQGYIEGVKDIYERRDEPSIDTSKLIWETSVNSIMASTTVGVWLQGYISGLMETYREFEKGQN